MATKHSRSTRSAPTTRYTQQLKSRAKISRSRFDVALKGRRARQFGEGKLLTLEGLGDDAKAQVNFPRHGVKWLALSVAKLTPI